MGGDVNATFKYAVFAFRAYHDFHSSLSNRNQAADHEGGNQNHTQSGRKAAEPQELADQGDHPWGIDQNQPGERDGDRGG